MGGWDKIWKTEEDLKLETVSLSDRDGSEVWNGGGALPSEHRRT